MCQFLLKLCFFSRYFNFFKTRTGCYTFYLKMAEDELNKSCISCWKVLICHERYGLVQRWAWSGSSQCLIGRVCKCSLEDCGWLEITGPCVCEINLVGWILWFSQRPDILEKEADPWAADKMGSYVDPGMLPVSGGALCTMIIFWLHGTEIRGDMLLTTVHGRVVSPLTTHLWCRSWL